MEAALTKMTCGKIGCTVGSSQITATCVKKVRVSTFGVLCLGNRCHALAPLWTMMFPLVPVKTTGTDVSSRFRSKGRFPCSLDCLCKNCDHCHRAATFPRTEYQHKKPQTHDPCSQKLNNIDIEFRQNRCHISGPKLVPFLRFGPGTGAISPSWSRKRGHDPSSGAKR